MTTIFYDGNHDVNLIYYIEIPEELAAQPHMQVEELPEPEEKEGKYAKLKCDGTRYWYEYVDIPPAPEPPKDSVEGRLAEVEKELLASQLAAADEFEARLKAENDLLETQKGIAELFEMLTSKEA